MSDIESLSLLILVIEKKKRKSRISLLVAHFVAEREPSQLNASPQERGDSFMIKIGSVY